MKINIKKQIMEMMQTLYEAIDYVRDVSSNERIELLKQCQEFNNAIENTVKSQVDQNSAVMSMFRKCNHLLLNLQEHIEDKTLKDELIKEIMFYLEEIYQFILEEIPTEKRQAVFLIYKASMWDAFDSIYRTVKEDGEWEAIVVPIPYFNINREGKVFSMHYEGSELPKCVQITDYQAYDIPTQQPDIIFISNPYDDRNIVTQVPKQYFSSELRKHTNKLVYIPYFVTGGKVEDHFTILPGVLNSWRTFVENEQARESYLRFNDSNKIIALGSPKNDMVKYINKVNMSIPKEWQSIILDKNVFMYNSHIRSIMVNPDGFIKKLRYIIEIFNNRPEEVILWRPHPLSMETIKSVSPQIQIQYLEVIEEFKQLKNGIYDDTADLNRAIAMSDAYIGDRTSSVVALYQQTGKPIYIFNLDNYITCEEDERTLYFSAGTIVEDELWFSTNNFNGLFKMDLKSNTIRYVTQFSLESKTQVELHSDMVAAGEYLYFIPSNGKYITVVNKQSGHMKYFEIRQGNVKLKFCSAYIKGEQLWVFPNRYNAIVKINLITEEIEYFEEWYHELKQKIGSICDIGFEGKEIVDETVWLTCPHTNIILSFDLNTQNYMIHNVGAVGNRYSDLLYDGKQFWIINTNKQCITLWNIKDNLTQNINILDQSGNKVIPKKMALINNYIWGVVDNDKKIFRISLDNNHVEWLSINEDEYRLIESRRYGNNFIEMCEKDYFIYWWQMIGDGIYKIDINTKKVEILSTRVEKELFEAVYQQLLDTKDNIFQEKIYTLPRIIDFINEKNKKLSSNEKNSYNNLQESAGYKIWQYILSHA